MSRHPPQVRAKRLAEGAGCRQTGHPGIWEGSDPGTVAGTTALGSRRAAFYRRTGRRLGRAGSGGGARGRDRKRRTDVLKFRAACVDQTEGLRSQARRLRTHAVAGLK